jgi:PAS domain S-box-containing protein
MDSNTRPHLSFQPGPGDLDAAFRFYGRVTSDLITILDRSGHILFVSAVAERIFGCSPEACLGSPLFDFVHPDDREASRKAYEGWLAKEGSS